MTAFRRRLDLRRRASARAPREVSPGVCPVGPCVPGGAFASCETVIRSRPPPLASNAPPLSRLHPASPRALPARRGACARFCPQRAVARRAPGGCTPERRAACAGRCGPPRRRGSSPSSSRRASAPPCSSAGPSTSARRRSRSGSSPPSRSSRSSSSSPARGRPRSRPAPRGALQGNLAVAPGAAPARAPAAAARRARDQARRAARRRRGLGGARRDRQQRLDGVDGRARADPAARPLLGARTALCTAGGTLAGLGVGALLDAAGARALRASPALAILALGGCAVPAR